MTYECKFPDKFDKKKKLYKIFLVGYKNAVSVYLVFHSLKQRTCS